MTPRSAIRTAEQAAATHGRQAVREPAGPRVPISSRRAGWCRLVRRLNDSLLGDLIGAACLFGTLWIGLIAAWVLQ